MRSKVVTLQEAVEQFQDGQTILFGDWHGQFSAEEIIGGVLEKGVVLFRHRHGDAPFCAAGHWRAWALCFRRSSMAAI